MKPIRFGLFTSMMILLFACNDEDTFRTQLLDFEFIDLPDGSFWNGSDGTGNFTFGNKTFKNTFYPDWNTWSGFAYSNIVNYQFFNESAKYASYASGGANESENYLVAHQFEKIRIEFEKPQEQRLVQITNCTYSALAIKYGYGNAKEFGGRDGRDPDWFKLTITGFNHANAITGTIDFFLADFRFENDADDYIVDNWPYVDLTSLGIVKSLEFELSSSDAGTPLYFCLDNLKGRIHY